MKAIMHGHVYDAVEATIEGILSNRKSRFIGPTCTNDRIHVNLKPGDHIFTERNGELYFHHGIVVGGDRVIHFTGPTKDGGNRAPCETCNHTPPREGRVVETCLNCFLRGHKLYVYEYGVRVNGNNLDPWIKDKLNSQRTVYARSNAGYIHIGILLGDDRVFHLKGPKVYVNNSPPCSSCDYKPDKKGGFVVTCLECFCRGNLLLYIGEHGIPVCNSDRNSENMFLEWACPKSLYHQTVMKLLCKGIDVLSFLMVCREEIFSPYVRKKTRKRRIAGLVDRISWGRFGAFTAHDQGRILHNRACLKPDERRRIAGLVDRISWERFGAFTAHDQGRIVLHNLACLKPDDIVGHAKRLLRDGFGSYNLISNNCEHFATICKTGEAVSTQVRAIADFAVMIPIHTEMGFLLSRISNSVIVSKW